MRTKSLREALMNLAEEAAELSAASVRVLNREMHQGLIYRKLLADVRKQHADVAAVWREYLRYVKDWE